MASFCLEFSDLRIQLEWSLYLNKQNSACWLIVKVKCLMKTQLSIMAYGSTPYVGMTPIPKNGGHIKNDTFEMSVLD